MEVNASNYRIIFYLLCLILLASCEKEPIKSSYTIPANKHWMLFLNQGNFQWNNASLDGYNLENDSFYSDLYYNANQALLGDVLQSACIINNQLFLVVNNSSKIEVVNRDTFKKIYTISKMNSPRYIAWDSSSTAYISDLYGQCVYLLNIPSQQFMDTIFVPAWADHISYYKSKLYIACMNKARVYIADVNQSAIIDSIVTNGPINDMLIHGNYLFIAYANIENQNSPGGIVRYHLITKEKSTFPFASNKDNPTLLAIKNKDSLLYVNTSIYAMNVNSEKLESQAIISENQSNYFGIYVAQNGNIWTSDAQNFTQKSIIKEWQMANGQMLMKRQLKAGINCGAFLEMQ